MGAAEIKTDTGVVQIWRDSSTKDVELWVNNTDRMWKFVLDESEGEFVLRDYTGGTTPIVIHEGADDNSIVIDSAGKVELANGAFSIERDGTCDINSGTLHVTSSGNVGIGTTTPNSILEIDFALDNLEFADADEDGGDGTQFGNSTLPINGWIKVELGGTTHYIPTTETEP